MLAQWDVVQDTNNTWYKELRELLDNVNPDYGMDKAISEENNWNVQNLLWMIYSTILIINIQINLLNHHN